MPLKISPFSCLCLCSSMLFGGDKQSSLDKWFDSMNIVSSTAGADLVSGHSLGVNFLGGTGVVKGRVIDLNPLHIQLPQFSAGCGGISYTMGALHLLSKDELVKAGKAILSNAGAYAFELALHTASPIVASQMGKLQSYANQWNGTSINSCQLGRNLVNAAYPNSEGASDYICQHAGENVLFEGLIERRHQCAQPSSNASNPKHALVQQVEQSSDAIVENYNLAWKIFNKIDQLSSNMDDMNMLLNLTGTIVRTKKGTAKAIVIVYPSKGKDVWKTILGGGTLPGAYFFLTQNRKDPTGQATTELNTIQAGVEQKKWTIPPEQAWATKILRSMKSLQQKIRSGRSEEGSQYGVTEDESLLLKGNILPIGTLLVVDSRQEGGKLTSLSNYAYLEAFQRLYHVFSESLTKIREVALSLKGSQISSVVEDEIDEFLEHLQQVNRDLLQEGKLVRAEINQIQQFDKFLREKENYQRVLEVL